jgi:hypothetical protein
MLRSFVLLSMLSALTGCVSGQDRMIKQASFDHDCPPDKIEVLSEDTSIWSYNVNVCGKTRKYRDLGNEKEFQFVDVTDGVKAQLKSD